MIEDEPVLGQDVNVYALNPPVRAALVSAEGMTTESLARERRLSDSLGIAPRMLRPNIDKAEREVLARRILADPVLGYYAGQSPENAALARDDEQGLLGVIRAAVSSAWEATKEAGRDVGESWGAGRRQMGLADLGNRLADGDESALVDIEAWYTREGGFQSRDSFADTLGLTSAVAQLPRMLTRDLPTSAGYGLLGASVGAGGGAMAGAALGGVGAGPGAMVGARLGGKAGWLAGTARTSYEAERGSFAAELSRERDENGKPLDPEVRNAAATAYGVLSAAVETAGEAVFLKLLSPLAGRTLSKLGVKPFLRSAVKRAAWDKSVQAALLDVSRRVAGGALTEGVEEAVQQILSIVVESTAKRSTTVSGVNAFRDAGLFPEGSGGEIIDAGVEGTKAGLWLSGVPTVALGAARVRDARRVAAWSEKQKEVKAALDGTKVCAASPELAEDFLRRGAGVSGTVHLPAAAVLELYQSGTDILEPLGWDLGDVADAAALGQDLEAPLTRLHAHLDAAGFDAVADIMRPAPDAMNAVEAANLDERLHDDMDEVSAAFAEYQEEQNAVDAEMERIRGEISGAVESVPGLASQTRADSTLEETASGSGMTPERTADYYSRLLRNWAERRQERTGVPMAESLRKVNVQGLVRDERGKLLTPEEYEARLINRELEEARLPFWNSVWGKLDRESLKRDYPDAARELTTIYGRGIFARKGQGRALDDLAQEMESFHILPEGGGGDALMERLKQGSRPSLRMRQGMRGKGLFQPLNEEVNLDAPVAVVEVSPRFEGQNPKVRRKRFPEDVRQAVLAEFHAPEGVVNADTGWRINMSATDFHEHLKFSDTDAVDGLAQLEAVAALPDLMRNARLVESYEDQKKNPNIKSMHRFQAAVRVGAKDYSVKLTVKEFKDGTLHLADENPVKLYHHRLEKEMPAGNSDTLRSPGVNRPSAGIHEYSLRALLEDVKDSEGLPFFQAGNPLAARFADMPLIEADSSQWFGAGKEIDAGKERWRKAVTDWARRNFSADTSVQNIETEWKIQITPRGITKTLSHGYDELLAKSVPLIPQIVESGIYLGPGKKTEKLSTHIFANKIRLDDQDYVVGFVLREDRTGNRFYDHELTEIINPDWLKPGRDTSEEALGHRTNRGDVMNILRDKLGVNDGSGQILFQSAYQGRTDARASITPVGDEYLIQLYSRADLSSLLHETGHMFLFEMEQDIRAGLADESLQADYDTLQSWMGVLDDDAALKAEYDRSMKNSVPAYGKREFADLPDRMREDARNRAKQEIFARGFERYLREGKAPARSLESAFARFRKWLVNIYRKAVQLNVELSDEVRGVFDRLLATDAEMNARAVENGLVDLTARELDALGLKGADRAAVSGLMKSAVEAAAERMRADRDRRRGEQLKAWAREAKAEVGALPVYIARRDMQKTGLDKDTVRRNYGDRLAGEVLRALPGSLRKADGADPELFALEHGFEDAGRMLTAVRDAARKGDMVRERIRQKQEVWDAEFHPDDYLLETEEAAKQIEMVGRYAREALGKTVVGEERPPRVTEQAVLARVVSEKLAGMEMSKATRTGVFRLDMRRALAAERRAIAAGDWRAVLDANFQARIHMEFARRSLELARGVERLQKEIQRFTGMSKADPDARFLVGAVAQRHGLGRLDARLVTEERKNPADVLREWIKGAEEDGYPVFPENVLAGPDVVWKDMSVDAFRNMADGLRQIITVERNRRKLLTARNKADLDAVAEEIRAGVAAFRAVAPDKTVEKENAALKTLKGLHAVHTKIEALCLALDGDKQGPMWEYVYRPMTKAEDEQAVRFRAARDALHKLFFGAYSRGELSAMRRNREYVESVGEKLTGENMIALALNMGNEANIQRVREGHGWTDAQITDVLGRLTRKDWEFVQGVWDYLESFREESFRLQEDITGLRPQAVEARPLTVTTADGETVTLRGGYYPIKYNSEKGFMAFQREQREMDREFFGGNAYSAAQTRQGHLKARAAAGTKEPLLLELSVATDHVFNVVHDLSYRRAVLDVAKVIRHPVVRDALRGAVGMDMVNQFKPWLMDVANERQEPMHAVHRMANWARASSSVMQMGWKVTTMLAQPLGLFQTAEMLGYGYTAAGVKKVYANPLRLPDLLEETFARSPMMADRIRSFDREVRDMTKKLMPSSGLFGWVDKVRDSAFVPIGVIQMGVDLPTWWGGYVKGLRELGGDEARAAEYADSVVRLSQGGGATKDLARVQRGGPLLRLATMFYSYFNTFYNLAARRFISLRQDHSPAAVFRAANTALLLWFVPAVLGELMAGRGPDDDDDWSEWAGMQMLQYPFQAVVGVRDVASAVFGEYGYQISPAQSAPLSLVKWFKAVDKALEEENAGKLAKPTAEAVGYLFSLPMKQPIITVGNIWDYLTGEDPEFEARDLFFVKPKDRR